MINVQTNELLNKFLNEEIEFLSDQDRAFLTENREEIIINLYAIFSEEIPFLLEKGKCLNPTRLLQGLKLASFLKARETFGLLRKICLLSIETLEEALEYDLIEDLAFLLANTMDHWSHLKLEIEDPLLDEYVRSACLEALVYAALQGEVERKDIVAYFKNLFHRILNGELDNESFSHYLIVSCCDLWPGECLEEIRELFGLELVDEIYVNIEAVLEDYAKGKEHCLTEAKLQTERCFFWEEFHDKKDLPQKWDNFLNKFNKADSETKQFFKQKGRNETCACGSGQKYKKCCLNKPSLLLIEELAITYEPLEYSDAMKALSEEERDSILDLYPLIEDNPEKVLQKAPAFIAKYPDIPMLHNYLCAAYRHLNRTREAMRVVKNMQKTFPDYFFGRVEYALYLLRRGEPEKAHAVFENVQTLSQLYPNRTVFHITEWKAFLTVITLCLIQKDDVKQAKIYLQLLNKISPQCFEAEDLEEKIKAKIFSQQMKV